MGSIAIITARSNSKGIKNKNITNICNKPLMAYTIEAALASEMFDTVMVSTDCEEYAEIARSYGAEVPFLRSEALSQDTSSSWDAAKEVLDNYEKLGKSFDTVVLLQPTSPLRTAEDIKNAFSQYAESDANAVVSVCELEHSLHNVNLLPQDKSLVGFVRSTGSYARQLNPTAYVINGAIYIVDVPYLRRTDNIFREKCYAFIMEKSHSIDIDDEFDLIICKAIIEHNNTLE